jgi:hypothetical protein
MIPKMARRAGLAGSGNTIGPCGSLQGAGGCRGYRTSLRVHIDGDQCTLEYPVNPLSILIERHSGSDIVRRVLVVSPRDIEEAITAKHHTASDMDKATEPHRTKVLLNEHLLTADRDQPRGRISCETGNTDKQAPIRVLGESVTSRRIRRIKRVDVIFVR